MKNNKLFPVLIACLAFILSLSATFFVSAEENGSVEISTYSTYTNTDNSSEVLVQPYIRGTYFNSGYGAIGQIALGIIAYEATTVSHTTVDYIYVKATLQKYSSGNWVTVSSCYNSNTNAYIVSIGQTITVGTSGAYYRVYSYHSVTHGVLTEYAYGYSSPIWV